MEWSQPETLLLIAVFERCSCLWNTSLTVYKNKNKKQDAWRDIGTEFKISAEEAEAKMKSVLSAYRREKRKVTLSKKTGSGTADVFQPTWFAYERVNFMSNISKPRRTRESCKPTARQSTDAAKSNSEHNPGSSGEGSQEELDHHDDPSDQDLHEVARRRQEEPPAKRLKLTDKAQLEFDAMQALVCEKRQKQKDHYERALVQRQIDDILYNSVIVALRQQSGDTSRELSVVSHSGFD